MLDVDDAVVRHAQRHQRIGAGLDVELHRTVGLFDPHLGVGEIRDPILVGRRDGIALAVDEACQRPAYGNLAERPSVETRWLRIGRKAGRHRRRGQRIGVRGRGQGEGRPRGAQSEFEKLHFVSPVRAQRLVGAARSPQARRCPASGRAQGRSTRRLSCAADWAALLRLCAPHTMGAHQLGRWFAQGTIRAPFASAASSPTDGQSRPASLPARRPAANARVHERRSHPARPFGQGV